MANKEPFRFEDKDNCFNPDHPHNHNVPRNKSKRFYMPWYNDSADYNTNAPSYYDFLARWNALIKKIMQMINKLLDRDIKFNKTDTTTPRIEGDWQEWDDIINVYHDVNISTDILNALVKGSDKALYVYDLLPRVSEIENDISKIKNDITNIYNLFDTINGGGYERLVKNKDYEIVFFNGFYTESNDLEVKLAKTYNGAMLRIGSAASTGTIIQQPYLKNIDMHGSSDISDVPQSRIYGVRFINDYEWMNNPTDFIHTTATSSGSWTVYPLDLRASWNSNVSLAKQGIYYVTALRGYIDGYGRPFRESYPVDTLTSSCWLSIAATFFK